jgi:hypothetical protein
MDIAVMDDFTPKEKDECTADGRIIPAGVVGIVLKKIMAAGEFNLNFIN